MKDKFAGLPGSVDAGFRLVTVLGFSIASLLSSLLEVRVVPALGLIESSYNRPPASRRNRLGSISLLNLSLCLHIKQRSRVSSLKLGEPNRAGDMSHQVSQTFSTHIVNTIMYRVLKISCIIGLSVMRPKRLYTNHWLQCVHFRCNHAS